MIDPIVLEVIRCKLEAIANDGAKNIKRTAVSPAVADSGDCSCAIYDASGALLVGGGAIVIHFHTGSNGVEKILELHGDTLAPGDVFMVNDPYSGGGFHAQDVYVHMPIFAEDKLIGWVGCSAHMMDMGGSVLGSFSPDATECYQEAFRFPPVRISRNGEEQGDIWAILRNNIRLPDLVEIDIRSLISGCYVTQQGIIKLAEEYGADTLAEASADLIRLTEVEMRRRVELLEEGEYSFVSWSEWTEENFKVPCTLTVRDGKLTFDYTEASPQSSHYFNSKPYVITSLLGVQVGATLGYDLPLNEGTFKIFEVLCRPGSLLDAQPPAPIGAPHLDVGMNASEVGMHTLNLAIAASPNSTARARMSGPSAGSGITNHTLTGIGLNGKPDGWLMLDGGKVGTSAGHDRDPGDTFYEGLGNGAATELVDVEVVESWYPILINRRGPREGLNGAGMFRSGAGMSMEYVVRGTDGLSMTLMGNRERVPIAGLGGGLPGAVTEFHIRRRDGSIDPLACHQQGIPLKEGEGVLIDCASGGGWGDPLDREPAMVEADVTDMRISAEDAQAVYGVIVGDVRSTTELRAQKLRERLDRAQPAVKPLTWTADLRLAAQGAPAPLYVGVEQHGAVAISTRSGAPLAVSPDSWTDGCPTIEHFVESSSDVNVVAYLDPGSGHLLAVDVRLEGAGRSFNTAPKRWTEAKAA
ncbi:hydantoinase B/oxoprolinase family protein [Novosphingobium colocasiae]|uniref:Hydantoin utilization protein B n=1 Tax=Novosphingobium colocasiae TaxID=1256513 RepID=A0A918PND3_9SPHN|nr:hydantoinase B/oxoprolinase family protein [Novosphingobium colocasiae]GGZ17164.1 hydantoin utilization protein B [Novosphingobium colocasiae]